MKSKRVCLMVLSSLILGSGNAQAGAAAGGATEITQNIQMIADMLDRYLAHATQIYELKTKLDMIANDIQSGIDHEADFNRLVLDTKDALNGITTLLYESGLAAERFDEANKGYDYYLGVLRAGGDINLTEEYTSMAEDLRGTVKSLLKKGDLEADFLTNDKSVLAVLAAKNQNPRGQTEAIQITNELLLYLINLLQRMHTTMLAQAKMEASVNAINGDKRELVRAKLESYISPDPYVHTDTVHKIPASYPGAH